MRRGQPTPQSDSHSQVVLMFKLCLTEPTNDRLSAGATVTLKVVGAGQGQRDGSPVRACGVMSVLVCLEGVSARAGRGSTLYSSLYEKISMRISVL
jgi:hypothetical protein